MPYRQRYISDFMDHTFEVAKETPRRFNAAIACTMVYRNREIICTCTNINKTHPFQRKFSKNEDSIYLHSENNCIVTALRKGFNIEKFSDCSLYIARASVENNIHHNFYRSIAKPCPGCVRSIVSFGIARVYYTTNNGGVEEL